MWGSLAENPAFACDKEACYKWFAKVSNFSLLDLGAVKCLVSVGVRILLGSRNFFAVFVSLWHALHYLSSLLITIIPVM